MVNEREDAQADDILSEEQAALDAQQDAQAAPRYVTTAELEALRGQIARLEAENRGLQGKLDKGLNAIRRDTEEKARRAQMDEDLRTLPEEYQPVFRRLMDNVSRDRQREEVAEFPALAGKTPDAVEWVRAQGVDPDSSHLDYAALTRNDTTAFIASLVRAAKASPVPTRQSKPSSQTSSSPRADATPGRAGRYGSADEIQDAYIRDEITLDDRNKRLQALGKRP